MALPFLQSTAKKRDQMLAIDLGGRTTKAVHLQRKGDQLVMTRYALMDAPIFEKSISAELLAEHLKTLCQEMANKGKLVALAVGVQDSLLRHADLPQMPVGDMRQVLKNNSKNYLQQDLPGHVFDCSILASRAPVKETDKSKISVGSPKFRVLVAGAKQQYLNDLQSAVRTTGLVAEAIMPGMIGPVNTFESAMPDVFSKEVVALVDIGFKHTTICLLLEGEMVLSRVVGIGGDRLTNGLAESLGISYAEAEGIKIGMPNEVQSNLESLVLPLGRELRASIDFFEHQQDKTVSQVFVSGGTSRSECIMQLLQAELMVECKPWNPLASIQLDLSPEQAAEIQLIAPQLAVATGAAIAAI
jgi:type IV pilus assembly protein PilM